MTTFFIVTLSAFIFIQFFYIHKLEKGCFDALSHAAGVSRLTLLEILSIPTAIIALDMRGMHELNAVLNYLISTSIVARVIRVHDNRCQFGGDEIVIFIPFPKKGTAEKIMFRIIEKCKEETAKLSDEKRQELIARTGGKIDGIHVAIVSIDRTKSPLTDTLDAMNEIEHMKEDGAIITGNRASTGKPGTLYKIIR